MVSTKEILKKIKERECHTVLADTKSIKPRGSRFRYRIIFDHREEKIEQPLYRDSLEYRQKSHSKMIILLKSQLVKSKNKLKMKDYQISMTDGYTGLKSREFYDYFSGMKLMAANKKAIQLHRIYYKKVFEKTLEILQWLEKMHPSEYSRQLHAYLLRLIVTPMPIMSEKERVACQEKISL